MISLLTAAVSALTLAQPSLTDYVDPRIGSGDHGHVFIGANVPFGMVMAGPTQDKVGWDWCSGYHESGSRIVGFAQTHLSGTGCSDLGDIALMPVSTDVELTREGLATPFSHSQETIRPGYYSVILPERGVRTEITATCRTALYRFSYDSASDQRLVIDLDNGVGDRVLYGRLTQIDDTTFVGYRISHGWANEQHIYFAMRLSKPANISRFSDLPTYYISHTSQTSPIYELTVDTDNNRELYVRIALSPVSEMNALDNMRVEATDGWNFDAVKEKADAAWNRELSRVEASFLNDHDKTVFYTSMYHFMVAPQTWDDACGDFRGADNRVYRNPNRNPSQGSSYLTTLSLWDTYRAAAPLSTIILPDMMPAVVNTYLRIYREQSKLPVWHLMSQETDCMVGCPAVPILADLLLKGYVSDTTLAWEAMRNSLMMDERGLDDMKALGYVASDHHGGSLSMSLEYMLADWAAAEAAHAIATAKGTAASQELLNDMNYFYHRSKGYTNLYDTRVGFLRPRDSQQQFPDADGFNPSHQTRDYTEGTPWQYLWLVPHDIEGLVSLLGGREKAQARLDSLFLADSNLNQDANPDISGLIGQYAHGNEPSHHIVYLYTLMGQPAKTAALVRRIMRELYSDKPAGLCGNEDVGQMSAWYILSALGFYQVEPCGGRYVIGSPLVKEATLRIGNNRTFTIRTHGLSEKAFKVRKVLLNGKNISNFIINHEDIMAGGTLDFYMK
ncbi:MAG: GH92 family glycosyl hydrolase [Bacteroidaceae bacterium]|nr:GH92 family glycosyl hydrolase [Bacteroidaceae bacterium]